MHVCFILTPVPLVFPDIYINEKLPRDSNLQEYKKNWVLLNCNITQALVLNYILHSMPFWVAFYPIATATILKLSCTINCLLYDYLAALKHGALYGWVGVLTPHRPVMAISRFINNNRYYRRICLYHSINHNVRRFNAFGFVVGDKLPPTFVSCHYHMQINMR